MFLVNLISFILQFPLSFVVIISQTLRMIRLK